MRIYDPDTKLLEMTTYDCVRCNTTVGQCVQTTYASCSTYVSVYLISVSLNRKTNKTHIDDLKMETLI